VITSGLKAGESVIVEGVIKVQPGAVVRPVPANLDKSSAPPALAGP
jgi:membrane fusion protein, multidrug efflux system